MKKLASFLICLFLPLSLVAKPVESIPFEMYGNLIQIKILVNDHTAPISFLFDTGASTTVLDKSLAEKLAIESIGESNASGASASQRYQLALFDQLKLGKFMLTDIRGVLVDLGHLGNGEIKGIIGADLLGAFITEINYDDMQLHFYKSLADLASLPKNSFSFKFKNGIQIPQIEGSITLENGKKYKSYLLIDTGADLSLMMNSTFLKKYQILKQINKKIKVATTGLVQEEESYEGIVPNFKFEGQEFLEVPALFSQSKEGVNSYKGYMGILGNEILKRCNWVFDYQSKMAYYQPNKLMKKPFEYPCAGFGIKQKEGKLVVKYINEEVFAYQKGLRENDELMSINGFGINDYLAIEKLLRTDNQVLEIVYRSGDGDKKTMKVKIKRLL